MKLERKAYYFEKLAGIHIPEFRNGMSYNIIKEENTLWGTELVLALTQGRKLRVPKEIMVVDSGNVGIAMSEKHLSLFEEAEISVIHLRPKSRAIKTKVIVPILAEEITRKLRMILTREGDRYYVFNRSVSSGFYGYCGIILDERPPVEGASLKIKTVVPFSWNTGRTRWVETCITFSRVIYVRQIGINFFEVRGIIQSYKPDVRITAYVSL